MSDSFSFLKMVSSPFTGMYWVKVVMLSLGSAVLFFIGLAVYKAYIKPPAITQSIRAEKGSTVTVIQQSERKKVFIPFIEGFVEQESREDFSTGIRGGLRFEF